MAVKQFYLVGSSPDTARDIDITPSADFAALQKQLALEFNIVEPTGLCIGLQTDDSGALTTLDSITATITPIGITIDGQPIREPTGPDGFPLVGSFYEIFPDHLGNHARLFRKYGSVIKTTNMGKTTYLTEDPRVAAHALTESQYFSKRINKNHPLWGIKDNNAIFINDTETEQWRQTHKFIPPVMSPKAVRHYTPLMEHTVRESFKVFDALDDRGETWNAYQYMLKLASQTIGKFALDLDLGQFETPESPLHPIVTNIAALLHLNKAITARGEWYRYLPFGDPKKLRQVQQTTYSILQECIDRCLARQTDARDIPLHEAALKATCVVDALVRGVDDQGNRLPRELLLASMVPVTGAGFTTTSALLSWCLYALCTYPGVQDRLLQDLVDNGINNDITWDPDRPNTLHYLDNFIKETQRLHNPSYQPGRTAKKEVIVPGGYKLPAESVIIPAIRAIHVNPDVWSNPQRFEPERWDTEEVKNRHRCAYIPFAAGQRGCIGFNFALQEVKVLLAELVYRYEFEREGTDAIEYDPEFQLIRPLNLYIRARRRTQWPEKS
ncbi:cytochrome P450, partial [Ascodesmis nigricans]